MYRCSHLDRSATAKMANGKGSLKVTEVYDASSGTPLRRAIDDALGTSQSEDSEVQLIVYTLDRGGRATEVGVATVSLEDDILAKNRDLLLTPIPILDSKSKAKIGELNVAVTALAVLDATGTPRTAGGGAASESVRVEISELNLKNPPTARGGMQVLVDMLLVRDLEEATKKGVAKTPGVWAFDYAKDFSVAKATKLRGAIAAALESDDQSDSQVRNLPIPPSFHGLPWTSMDFADR